MEAEHIFIIDDDKFFAKYFIMRLQLLVSDHVEFHHYTGLQPLFSEDEALVPALIFADNILSDGITVHHMADLSKRYPTAEIILISASNPNDPTMDASKSVTRYISKDDLMMDNIGTRINEELEQSKHGNLYARLFKVS